MVVVVFNIENCAFRYNSEEKKPEYLALDLYGSHMPQQSTINLNLNRNHQIMKAIM